MKKRAVLLLMFVPMLNAFTAAQTLSRVITGNGYLYKYDVDSGYVTFYNTENQFTYIPWARKDCQDIDDGVFTGKIKTTEDDNWTAPRAWEIVENAFTPAQKQTLKGQGLAIRMIVDSTTGKITEVDFNFQDSSPFRTIPISTFRAIETGLKQNIWFTVTEYGKKMNYCMVGWMQTFN